MTEEEEPLGEDVEGQSEALKKRNSLTGAWKKSFKAAKVQVARDRAVNLMQNGKIERSGIERFKTLNDGEIDAGSGIKVGKNGKTPSKEKRKGPHGRGKMKEQQQAKGGGAKRLMRLCRPGDKRSEEDVQRLAEISRNLSHFFRSLPDVMQIELAKAMTLEEFLKYDSVFKQGEAGYKFYIIASGKVDINVTIREEKRAPHELPRERTTTVATLSKGESFGEIALVKDQPRSATIVAKTRIELLVIHKDDFQRTLTDLYGSPLSERCDFLESLPTFQGIPRVDIITMAQFLSIAVFSAGTTFHPDKDQRVCFIVDGHCRLRKGNKDTAEKERKAAEKLQQEQDDGGAMNYDRNNICSMGPGNFFGESCVFEHLRREWYVEALTQVKLFFLSKQDFLAIGRDLQARVEHEAEFKVTYHDEVLKESMLRQRAERERRQAMVRQEETRRNKEPEENDDEEEQRRIMNPDREFHQEGARLNDLEDFKMSIMDSVNERADHWNSAGCWPKVRSPRGRPYTAADASQYVNGSSGAGGAGVGGYRRAATTAAPGARSRTMGRSGLTMENTEASLGSELSRHRLPALATRSRGGHGGTSGASTQRGGQRSAGGMEAGLSLRGGRGATWEESLPATPRTARFAEPGALAMSHQKLLNQRPQPPPPRAAGWTGGGGGGGGGGGEGMSRHEAFASAGMWGIGGKSTRHAADEGIPEFRAGTRDYVFAEQLEAKMVMAAGGKSDGFTSRADNMRRPLDTGRAGFTGAVAKSTRTPRMGG